MRLLLRRLYSRTCPPTSGRGSFFNFFLIQDYLLSGFGNEIGM
jgi:hypothetical protein